MGAANRSVRPDTTTWWLLNDTAVGRLWLRNAGACDFAAAGEAATTTENAIRSATFKQSPFWSTGTTFLYFPSLRAM